MDVDNHGSMLSAVFSGEVTSVETWRSLILVSTKGGVSLHDLDDITVRQFLPVVEEEILIACIIRWLDYTLSYSHCVL